SALLLAGLASHCSVVIREDSFTRDHTERMLAEIGEGIETRKIKAVPVENPDDPRKKKMVMPEPFKYEAKLSAQAAVKGGEINIPGDISTAAFFMTAAAITQGTVTIKNVGLNLTRTAFIDHLKLIGCEVNISDKETISGEPRGTVTVTGSKLKPRKISGETTVGLIDEIPLVAILAAFTEGTTVIRDAAELKVKESNRLEAIHHNLNLTGAKCGLLDDGLAIEGGRELSGADFVGFGDHRLVMAFSIAALSLAGPSTIDDDSPAAVSCPEFYDILESIIK
ncbi:MAG: 3-phosphoshikimate 1-carboxyvinyltransferase, partial [candidate division Zixibacteria bacterium]|nr:3-phosphoshikimate 1-carboxyvinyltransferase [candidate division Zixibacteria bacterium]